MLRHTCGWAMASGLMPLQRWIPFEAEAGAGFWACSMSECGFRTSDPTLLPHEAHVAAYQSVKPSMSEHAEWGLRLVQAQADSNGVTIPVAGLQGMYELRPLGSTGGEVLKVLIYGAAGLLQNMQGSLPRTPWRPWKLATLSMIMLRYCSVQNIYMCLLMS